MVQINFNANQYAPSTGGQDVLEDGIYSVQITNSELKATKRGDGYMLVFTATCIDAAFAGKRVIIRLNIQNPNQQAVEIAYGELSALSHVIGILNWTDTQQLHGRPFKLKVEKKPRDDDPTKFGNEIKGYLDYAGNPPSPQGAGHAPTSAAPAAPQQPQQQPAQQFQQPAHQPQYDNGGYAQQPQPAQQQAAPAPATTQPHAGQVQPATGSPNPGDTGQQPWNNHPSMANGGAAPAPAPAPAQQQPAPAPQPAQQPFQQQPAPAPATGAAPPWGA